MRLDSMISTTSEAASIETSSSKARASNQAVGVALGKCLVSSADNRLRRLLVAAAREGGWQTRDCATPEEAIREAVLHRTPLALVDVGSVEDRASHADLLRMVRTASNGLVVVCDHAANPEGELWARQEGAWVYLAGVNESSDIALVCQQARLLMQEKQEQQQKVAIARTASQLGSSHQTVRGLCRE